MSESLGQVIQDARREGDYRCARCDYPLRDVPLDEELAIVCPECGYEMVFHVKVRLMPRDPNYDREIRGPLGRLERLALPISLILIATAVGLALVVYALTA